MRGSGRWMATLAVAGLLAASWAAMSTTTHFVIALAGTYLGLIVIAIVWSANRRTNLIRWIAITATLAACAGVLEVPAALRWLDYRGVFATPILAPDDNPHFEWDDDLLFRRRPGGRFTGSMPAGDMSYVFDVPDPDVLPYDVTYDAHGFRNTAALTSARVVVLGDSFVEGTYVAEHELLTGVMAGRLGAPVANLGVIAYGPQQELVVLERYGLPLEPDTVVWLFFEGNDLKDAERYETIRAHPEAAIARKHAWWGRSFTKNALQFASRLAGDPKPSALPRSAWFTDAQGARRRVYFLYPGLALGPEFDRSLQLTSRAFADGHRLAAAQGARLVVAFAPTKYRVLRDVCTFDPGAPAASWPVNDLPDRMRHLVASISPDIVFVDLTPPLQEAARAGTLPYARDDAHWSALGHRVAAEAILAALDRPAASRVP